MQNSILLGCKILLSRREFSLLTGLSLRTIAKLVASGEVDSIRVGRRRLIPRSALDRFVKRDHSISQPTTVALRSKARVKRRRPRPKKRSAKSHRADRRNAKRVVRGKKRAAVKVQRRRLPAFRSGRKSLINRKVLAVASRMRRQKISLAKAAKLEHIKQRTALRYGPDLFYRSGPGKPWKVRRSDRRSEHMTVIAIQGPISARVRGSVERTRLARYDIALRKFRAGEDGAVEELRQFEGQAIAGYPLITDLNLLIQLEEAGLLDFDNLYHSGSAT
jgi:excisionase family DNA binding protein